MKANLQILSHTAIWMRYQGVETINKSSKFECNLQPTKLIEVIPTYFEK